MRKIFLTALFFFAAVFTVSQSYAQDAKKRDLSEFAGVQSIESNFKMSKYLSITDKPLVSEGKFYFQRPQSLRWEYIKPYPYGFIMHDGKTLSWQEHDGKKEVKDISAKPGAKDMAQQLYTFISMDTEKISQYYTVENIDNGIVLHPKNKSKKQMIEKINILFSATEAAVRLVEILEKNGDKTVISFDGTIINGTISQNEFSI